MDFIKILTELMKENNLNQTQLANLLGIKQSQVSEWLKGKSKPGYDNLKNLCIALGVSADIVLGLKDL